MKIIQKHTRSLTLICLIFILAACNKEKKWTSEIITINEDEPSELVVEADFYLPGNDNYVYVGVCISDQNNPTISSINSDRQMLDSDMASFYFDGLMSNTIYYLRSYIITSSGQTIYSEEDSFKTQDDPEIPCETVSGSVEVNGSTIDWADLSESTGEYYSLDTYSGFGDLTFTFKYKPTTHLYKTVESNYDLTSSTVKVEGILGYGFSCFYGNATNMDIYVTVDENEDVSVAFCDLKMSTGGSCEDFYLLTGKLSQ